VCLYILQVIKSLARVYSFAFKKIFSPSVECPFLDRCAIVNGYLKPYTFQSSPFEQQYLLLHLRSILVIIIFLFCVMGSRRQKPAKKHSSSSSYRSLLSNLSYHAQSNG
jgi:hypothetical protein